MKFFDSLGKRRKGKGLRKSLMTIETLVFVLPALVMAYIFYVSDVPLRDYHVYTIAFTLLLVLGGLVTLRQIFDKFLLFTNLMKKVEDGEKSLTDIHRETEGLHEVSSTFQRLILKLDETTAELRRRVFELLALKELTETATRTLSLEDLLAALLDKAMAVSEAKIGSVFLVDSRKKRLRVVATKGLSPGPEKDSYVSMNNTLLRHVVASRKPLIVENIETDPRTRKQNDPRYGSPSFLSMPVLLRKNLIGVLSLAGKESMKTFDNGDEQILSIMIGEIAFALENARLHSSLKEHAEDLERQTEELTRTNRLLEEEISERRRAESELQRSKKEWEDTFEAMSDWITLTDPEGRILRSNGKGRAMVGKSPDAMTGIKCCVLFHHSEVPVEGCPRERVLVSGKRETGEFQGPVDGRWYMVTVDPVRDEEGRITGMVHIVRDITRQKEIEASLLRAEKLESIGLLAGGIAHDFNNILTVIMGCIELAQLRRGEEGEVHRLLKQAEATALRAKELARQFITFSDGGEPLREPGSLVNVLERAAGRVVEGSGVALERSFPPEIRSVEFDESQMLQAFGNVISNSLEAMPGGGVIRLSAENRDIGPGDDSPLPEGKYVRVAIEDEGVGIPRENLPMIFDPYFSTGERGSLKGIGLGLTTTYSIIKRHGGHIHVTSEAGRGTCVAVTLPA